MSDYFDGDSYAALSDDGRPTVLMIRPAIEWREAEVAQVCRQGLSVTKSLGSQLLFLGTLEALSEIQ